MKIKLTHSAQVAGSKGKVEQHPPGKKLDIDDEQALRLIRNGYAVVDEEVKTNDDDAGGGGGGGAGGSTTLNPGGPGGGGTGGG